ncbi:MAG: hypothetical protein OEQ13_07715 [Acidobacteriota bacterium]|nr:hypothetical protein [Acidobacteriota bacterium]
MSTSLDAETIERFRKMPIEQAFRAAKDAVYGLGNVGSEDFLDVYEQLVEAGVMSWAEIETLEAGARR